MRSVIKRRLGVWVFKLRHGRIPSVCRSIRLQLLGATIGRGTYLGRTKVTWPHNLAIGKNCLIEDAVIFKIDGPWAEGVFIRLGDDVFIGTGVEFNCKLKIKVGNNSLVASGVRLVDHEHGMRRDHLVREQSGVEQGIEVGQDCWIGANAVITSGVTIRDGAVVGAGAVVTKDIPAYEIWAGVPARKIGERN